jgi:prepilin-type N-terminal cleavage/methylation domain-containing protein
MRIPLDDTRRGRAGFSLVELVLAVAILGSVVGTVALVHSRSDGLARASTEQNHVNLLAARAADRVVRELASMGASGAIPDPTSALGTDSITFRQARGIVGGVVQWGPPMRFQLDLGRGETANGADDDGDGLVDERALVLISDLGGADERRTVLCDGVPALFPGELSNVLDDNGNGVVDERGFNLRRVGDVMQVRVCVAHGAQGGSAAVATVVTSVRLRN